MPTSTNSEQGNGMAQPELDFGGPKMTPTQRAVLAIINNHHGHENAICGKMIGLMVGNLTNVQVGSIIRELVMEHGKIIGSAPAGPPGYFIPNNYAEVSYVVRSLRSRGLKILERAAKFRRQATNEWLGQLSLELRRVDDNVDQLDDTV